MTTLKLSDAKVKTLKPKEKSYRILDVERLYIEVRPSGAKIWRFRFVLNGKESTMSFGEYPAVGLADARRLRDAAKLKLAQGVSPVDARRQENKMKFESSSFESIAHEYKMEKLAHRSEAYLGQFDRMLQKDIPKHIKKKNIQDITSADILSIINNTIKRVKNQKNHGSGKTTAIQNRTFIGAIIRYAIVTLRAEIDPTYAVRGAVQYDEVNHARPLTKQEKYQVRINLDAYRGTETVKHAGYILLYAMLRSIEIRKMKWEWVDFEDRLITFPKEVMKKKRDHILPMSNQVHDVLQRQYLNSGNKEYVFPAVYKSSGMISPTTLNKMLEYIGLYDVTSHDFRATASTALNEKGYDADWIELQLAHANDNKTRATYNHARYLENRRKMLQDWADIVDGWKG